MVVKASEETEDEHLQRVLSQVHQMTQPSIGARLEDPDVRSQLLDLSKQMTSLLEPPEDTVIRQARLPSFNLAIRCLIDLGIFKILIERKDDVSAKELAALTSADELLLVRLLRAACALGFVDQVGIGQYKANKVTKAMTDPSLEAGFLIIFDNYMRPRSLLWEFVEYFRQNGYRNPDNARNGPFQFANDCVGKTALEFWMENPYPGEGRRFNTAMHSMRDSSGLWVDWFPVEMYFHEKISDSHSDRAFLVDVGGGHGTNIKAVARKFPDLRARMLLQDLPAVLDEVGEGELDSRVEKQAIDFFQGQPVRGARLYTLHWVLHDWPDSDSKKILQHLRDAMEPGYSTLLIGDKILPDMNCPLMSVVPRYMIW